MLFGLIRRMMLCIQSRRHGEPLCQLCVHDINFLVFSRERERERKRERKGKAMDDMEGSNVRIVSVVQGRGWGMAMNMNQSIELKTHANTHTCWYRATLSSSNRSNLVASLRSESNSREACSGVMPYAVAAAAVPPEFGADDNNAAPSMPIGPLLPEILCILSPSLLLEICCCCCCCCCSGWLCWATTMPLLLLAMADVLFEFELWPTTRRRNGWESDDDEDGMVEIFIVNY